MVAADARTAIWFALSVGNEHDVPAGCALLEELGEMPKGLPLLLDLACNGDEARKVVLDFGMIDMLHPSPTALHLGNKIGRSTRRETRSKSYSGGSRDAEASFQDLRNWTSSSVPS